jgi:hypothetical protein
VAGNVTLAPKVSKTFRVITTANGYAIVAAGGDLGTAALVNTGTSGATIPLLNAANTWSAAQTYSSVSITGGSISGITDLAVADGGTGASTPANARTNLGLGTAATVNTGTSGGTVPLLNAANTFAPGQVIQSTDAGADQIAGLILDRNSASPAVNDFLMMQLFYGRSAAAATLTFAALRPMITNIGAGTEAGQLELLTLLGGVVEHCAIFGAGVVFGGPTGGDKGRGTLNATNLFVNNSPVLKQSDIFVSADQTITGAGSLTLAHGLGSAPRLVQPAFVCQTAELGYSIGDVTFPYTAVVSCVPDATNLVIRYLSGALSVVNKTTGAYTAITPANWKARFLAIK